MYCEEISLAELPYIILTLACKSDVNDALPSHLVFDMHCGGPVDSQETACRIRFLCLALLDITFNTALSVLSPLLCLTRASRFAGNHMHFRSCCSSYQLSMFCCQHMHAISTCNRSSITTALLDKAQQVCRQLQHYRSCCSSHQLCCAASLYMSLFGHVMGPPIWDCIGRPHCWLAATCNRHCTSCNKRNDNCNRHK